MKNFTLFIHFLIVIFIIGLIIGTSIFTLHFSAMFRLKNNCIPNQMTLVVVSIRNDHDVILRDEKNNIYVISVENAYDEAFDIGTIIFFGKNEVIIK